MVSILKLLALALAPCIAIAIFVFYKDKFEKEPIHLLIKCYFLGALIVGPAILLNKLFKIIFSPFEFISSHLTLAFLIIALSEEICKYIVLRYYAYRKSDFNEPYDGIVYSVMIAMGFASAENAMYIFMQETYVQSLNVGLIRMFTAVPAHAAMGILMGYYVGMAKFKIRPLGFLLRGFFAAFLLHGMYDFFLSMENYPYMTAGALLSLFVSIRLSSQAMDIHSEESPYKWFFNRGKKIQNKA